MTRMFGKNSDYTSDPENPDNIPLPAEGYMMLGAADDDPVTTWDDPPTIAQMRAFFGTGDMTNGRPAMILRTDNSGRKELEIIADVRIRGNTTIIGAVVAAGTTADDWYIDSDDLAAGAKDITLHFGNYAGHPYLKTTKTGAATDSGYIYTNRHLDMGGQNITNVGSVDGIDISIHAANVNAHIDNLTDITTRNHINLQNVTANQHHNQQHELNGADHSVVGGTLDWAKVNKTGSNLTDLATRNHAGLQNVTSDQHHAQAHTHDTDTLQFDNVNSNGGAFGFTTTGAVTFNQNVLSAGLQLGGAGSTCNIIRDEDNMASDDAAALATQQSIKKYVDDSVGGGDHTRIISPFTVIPENGWTAGANNVYWTGPSSVIFGLNSKTSNNSCGTTIILPPDYKAGTDVLFHLYWTAAASSTPDYDARCLYARDGAAEAQIAVYSGTWGASGGAWLQTQDTVTIDGTNLLPGDYLHVQYEIQDAARSIYVKLFWYEVEVSGFV